MRAEESIKWTPEAEERMMRVPPQVKGIARTGILRLALEKGHSVVTNSVIDEAMDRFMPKQARDMTFQLAERMALELAERQPVAICKSCGVAASEADAVRCGVCGSAELERIDREMLERIAPRRGHACPRRSPTTAASSSGARTPSAPCGRSRTPTSAAAPRRGSRRRPACASSRR